MEIVPGREGAEFDAAQWFSGIPFGPVPVVVAQDGPLDLGGDSDTAEKLETWRELNSFVAMRGTTLALDEEGQQRQRLYDTQITKLRKRLGLKGDDG